MHNATIEWKHTVQSSFEGHQKQQLVFVTCECFIRFPTSVRRMVGLNATSNTNLYQPYWTSEASQNADYVMFVDAQTGIREAEVFG